MVSKSSTLVFAMFVTTSVLLLAMPSALGDSTGDNDFGDAQTFDVPFIAECNGGLYVESDSSNLLNMHTEITINMTVCISNPTNYTVNYSFPNGNIFGVQAVKKSGKVAWAYPPAGQTFSQEPVNISVGSNSTYNLSTVVWNHVPNGKYVISFVLTGYDLPSQNRSYFADQGCDALTMSCYASAGSGPSGATTMGALGATGGLVAVGVFFGLTEPGKYAGMAIVAPLFTRLKKRQVLDNFTRGRIEGYIMANPGAHMNGIRDAFELSNGVVAYHLRVLEREGFVTSSIDGLKRRFYPGDKLEPKDHKQELTVTQNLLVSIMEKNPGVTQTELAKMAGTSPQVVNYHIRKLWRMDLITMDKDGRVVKCWVRSDKLSLFKRNQPDPIGPAPTEAVNIQ
jgi:DNA-binding MarR family transcriptional regulator